jgi:dTDP-4-amino-4,6-dideoxygalactose transaminase
MIGLFNINTHTLDTSRYTNLLHDNIVTEFEDSIKNYVGAKYAVSFNSATSAIFLSLLNKNIILAVPSMIPPVVLNAIITSGNKYTFNDNVDWVGDSYTLHDFGDYKIVDSAQKLEKNQFKLECNDGDLMVFSFYPTKPVGGSDGGMIVSNDINKITLLKEMALNGMTYSHNNWERKIRFPGYKMYMNSIQADIAMNNFNLYEEKLSSLKKIRDIYNNELGYSNTSNHLYRIEVDNRKNFIEYMKTNGVWCGIHYEAAHLNSVYSLSDVECPLSEEKSLRTVSIPFHERLTISEVNIIIDRVKEYSEK